MDDRSFWADVLFALHDRNTDDIADLTVAEWFTVHDFMAVYRRETEWRKRDAEEG